MRPRSFRCAAGGLLLGMLVAGTAPTRAAEPSELVVGQVVTRSTGLVDTGREAARGVEACVRRVNASGGVHGRRLRLVVQDDGGDQRLALPRAQDLLERDDIAALIMPMGRVANGDVLPWAAREGLAVLAPYGAGALNAQATSLTSSFFLRTSPSVEALRLASQLQTLGIERIAIVYSDDDLGRETLTAFEEALASSGEAAAAVVPLHGVDAGAAVRALARATPQAVLLATVGPQTQAVLRSLDALAADGVKIVPYALSTAASQDELRELGAAARWLVVSQVLPSPRSTSLPVVRDYLDAIPLVAGPPPSYPGLEGCIGVLTLARVLRRGGDASTRSGVLRALLGAGVVDLGGWSVDLADRRRPGSRFTDITQIGADGRWTR